MRLRHSGILVKNMEIAVKTYMDLGWIPKEPPQTFITQKMVDNDGNIVELIEGEYHNHISVNWGRRGRQLDRIGGESMMLIAIIILYGMIGVILCYFLVDSCYRQFWGKEAADYDLRDLTLGEFIGFCCTWARRCRN